MAVDLWTYIYKSNIFYHAHCYGWRIAK